MEENRNEYGMDMQEEYLTRLEEEPLRMVAGGAAGQKHDWQDLGEGLYRCKKCGVYQTFLAKEVARG